MRRRLLVVLAGLAATCTAGSTARAVTSGQLPPQLRRLLAAERRLKLTGFLVKQSVVQVSDGRDVLAARIAERGRLSPPRYAITSAAGGPPVFLRYVGTYAYGTTAGLARVDGGHRWVRVRLTNLAGGVPTCST